ncbi:hypothetical protein Cgig2_016182 [Carnegiea gigantea]|uniref:Uncharacterized protein n=1 Tax=Carnegiea gigantea TaxID=171969 RepID=A0A9Q1KP79_9CARY|nr:hypothetical protein Cgig2_016182 [Carnegiea gigantea]
MEFLGKMVKKEFEGFGVFDGVVDSYDSSTGFFKILYEDGDSEEADISEVARLVAEAAAVSTSGDPIPALVKRVGRKPKRRRRNLRDPGKDSENLAADCSLEQRNLEAIEQGLGGNFVNEICVSANGNVNDNGLDLNRGLNFDDGVEKVETRGYIDLNLTVVNDEFDEDVEKGKKERNFDLNLGLSDEIGVNEIVDNEVCVGPGEELQNGGGVACQSMNMPDSVVVVDANHENSYRAGVMKLEESCPDVVALSPCEDGNASRRKRRKVARNLTSPTETVLRRSARRAKAVALNECYSSRVMSSDGANDLSMSGVTDESEEKPKAVDLGRPREPWVLPPKIELPLSSTNLNLEGIPVLDLFFVYSCLRSFSTLLYLSPFELEDLVAALKSRVSNLLIDFIHVSILQTLRRHLEFLANEGSESASTCLRNMNWDLLDVITWPMFMIEYLLIHGSGLKPGSSLDQLNLFDGEYYSQPAKVKLELLRRLCDDVIEVEATRSELSKRMVMSDCTVEVDRAINNDLYRKRRVSSGAHGDTGCSENMAEEVADGNSDECCLCKMDGNLICCDGCPAAYHTKCVGIISSLLPEGEWYCPECMVGKFNLGTKPQKLIRGADLLGIDPYGRSDSNDAESSFNYYHKDDLGAVIQLLRSYDILYESILNAISQQWGIPTNLHEPKSSSEGSPEVLQSNQLTINSPRPGSSEIADQDMVTNGISACKQRKRNRSSAGRHRSVPKTKEEDLIQGHSGDIYVNCYSFARTASSVVEELLRKPSDKLNVDIPKTEEEIISIQSKFILRKSTKFCWPTIQDVDVSRQKEKCGWCYCCRFPVEGRECLFSFVSKSPVAEGLKSEVDAVMLKKNKKGHIIDVICCVLYMEQRLRGLLLGPFLSPSYGELWRKSVVKASDVSSLKRQLLTVKVEFFTFWKVELESSLHPLAVSADWWKHVDSVATMGSASHFVANLRATSKNGISRRKGRYGDSEIKSLVAAGGLCLFWWRGGKVSRSLFNWKVVPRSLALKAARNAGRIKIPGIQYPDGSENARRSRHVAWRAAVETCTSLEQLALQVRELDMFLRWDDIENTHPHSILDKETTKSIRLFKKAIIRRKCVEGTLVKYLLDFGKRRSVPDVVIKHGIKVEDPSGEKKKYWLDESYVPLNLLKSFEERRITRKVTKTNSSKARKSGKSMKKPLKEKGFDYLFSRAERADSHQCGHCNKHVPIRSILVHWQDGCLGSEDQVDSRGRLAKLRAKARERGKTLSSSGSVLSGNNKKVQYHKKQSLQENANVSSGMTLRRSARKATYAPVQSNSSAGRKKRKRKRNKSRNVAAKETQKSTCCQKRSIRAVHSFWVNGLLFSKKPNDERVVHFKRRKLLVPSEFSAGTDDPPKCSLCSGRGFVSASMYIACEICGACFFSADWFHGDAFGLNKGNLGCVIGFKCHVCRERSPPVCPFYNISGGRNELRTQNVQGSLEEVWVQKETDCVLDMHSNEVSPTVEDPFRKFETVDNCATNVDCDMTPILHSELRAQNGSLDSQKVIANTIESQSGDATDLSSGHLQEFPPDDASVGCLDSQRVPNSVKNLDQVKSPLVDPTSGVQNGSPAAREEVTANEIESQSGNRADLSADCAQEFCSGDVSLGHIGVQSVEIFSGSLNHVKSMILDSQLRVENGPPPGTEVILDVIDGQTGNVEADFSSDHIQVSLCDGVSLGCSEVQTVQNSVGNLDQMRTPILDSDLRVENGLLASKEFTSNATEIESQIRDSNADLSTACVQKFQSSDGFLNCIEVQTEPNSDGNLDQIKTPTLHSELKVENGSPNRKEVVSNAIESKKVYVQGDELLEEPKEAKCISFNTTMPICGSVFRCNGCKES